jgi:CBS domain-containing protein
MPTRPLHELTIALAGPAVNVLLALLLLGIDLFLFGTRPFDPEEIFTNAEWLDASAEHVVRQLFVINVGLFAFNLLPAFPMDGGRALRALLAMRLSYVRATRWAARLGQALALAMGLAALLYLHSPILVLVAAFVFLSAGAEAAVVERKTYYKDRRAEAAMLSRFETVSPEDPLWKAVELLGAGAQTDFPVVRENAVLGVLHREELVRGLARRGLAASVADIGWREVPAVEADSSLEESYELLESQSLRTVPVVRNGELVGLLSRDKLVEYASIQRALEPKT